MSSLGETPSGGARALCLLWGFSKVSRRKGGTLSGPDRSNGYVPRPNVSSAYHIAIAGKPAPTFEPQLHLTGLERLSGRHASKLPRNNKPTDDDLNAAAINHRQYGRQQLLLRLFTTDLATGRRLRQRLRSPQHRPQTGLG